MANNFQNTRSRFVLTIVLLTAISLSVRSQYYYKDIITVKQINENFRVYKENKTNKVRLKSYQGNVPVSEGFVCEQTVDRSKNQLLTYTKTADAGESYFTSFYNNAGSLIKTIDSTNESVSTSLYEYDNGNKLTRLTHNTHATDNSSSSVESHSWTYNDAGKALRMVRVKNGRDSTIFSFNLDERGNVVEETPSNGALSGKYYYYYDAKNQLTDIVRYNAKARRLLPDYVFEYEENGELSTMMLVPEGSSDYQKWYYKYDEGGLKLVDFCYNKKNELQGKIEYVYTSGK